MSSLSDEELVAQCLGGSRQAYGQLVARFQNLVCSIAYSITGDFTRSEDIGQDAFITAWKKLPELADHSRFRSWISSITRNLAKVSIRSERSSVSFDDSDEAAFLSADTQEKEMIDEEKVLVWSVLEKLPENYREPLVLFYREEQSVKNVADSLELSESAVKQRLARGREMLRNEVTEILERVLKHSMPTTAFTAAVLGLLPGLGATTAMAASIGATAKVTPAVVAKAGLFSFFANSLGGLLGGGIGAWMSYKNARYQKERKWVVQFTLMIFGLIFLFLAPMIAISLGWNPVQQMGQDNYVAFYMAWVLLYVVALFSIILYGIRKHKHIIKSEKDSGAELLPESKVTQMVGRWEGRRWASKLSFLGLPLIHIAFGDPDYPDSEESPKTQIAKGWIALGDRAYGVLFAMGNFCVGGIAVGTLPVGLISFGAVPVGVVSFGGLAIGAFALGGLSIGIYSLGGLAAGVVAVGGAALGWTAAKGGVAIAGEYALGGYAKAEHANTEVAKQYFESHWFSNLADSYVEASQTMTANTILYQVVLMTLIFGFIGITNVVAYRKKKAEV